MTKCSRKVILNVVVERFLPSLPVVLTSASDIKGWSSVGVSCLAVAHDCIVVWIMWAYRIRITPTMIYLTSICSETRTSTEWLHSLETHCSFSSQTCADHIWGRARVRISCLADAYNSIGFSVMRTDGIEITSTIIHLTGIYTWRFAEILRNAIDRTIELKRVTCADDIGSVASVRISILASTSDHISVRIMWADGIRITSTVVDQAGV